MIRFPAALLLILGLSWCLATVTFALPNDRAYEMVSPVYKGGYGANKIEAVAPTGNTIAFRSNGAFAGTPKLGDLLLDYIARRDGRGWSTAPALPPASLVPGGTAEDVSSALESEISIGRSGQNETAAGAAPEADFLLHSLTTSDIDENWQPVPPSLRTLDGEQFTDRYEGASGDLCHLFLGEVEHPLLPVAFEETELHDPLYEVDRGCDGEQGLLRLVNLNNSERLIEPACGARLGLAAEEGQKASTFNAVADEGREAFFTTCVGGMTDSFQLFVRLDGAKTLEISRPVLSPCIEVPCGKAGERVSSSFVGASEDGSKAFFTTTASLANRNEVGKEEDTGKGELYMARIGCPENSLGCQIAERRVTSLLRISEDQNPVEPAEIQGVVRVAPNGSRIYFVAHGVMTEGANSLGRSPAKGADNLYVYDSASEETTFITDLCSGPGLSGSFDDTSCPLGINGNEAEPGNDTRMWLSSDGDEAQTAGRNGSVLVFSTYAQLVSGDTDTAKDVYRYDAETGLFARVSLGEEGGSANGNCDDKNGETFCDASITPSHWGGGVRGQYEMDNRAISEDGSRIVFESSQPLSPKAINGLENIYEWRQELGEDEGRVSLISSGNAEGPVSDVVMAPEGNDIFFVTSQGLIPEDGDGAPDIYDARIDGGFPEPPALRQPCSGDACQGPLTNPAPLLVPGSVSQAPGENFAATQVKRTTRAKTKRVKAKRKITKKRGKTKRARSKQSALGLGTRKVSDRGRVR